MSRARLGGGRSSVARKDGAVIGGASTSVRSTVWHGSRTDSRHKGKRYAYSGGYRSRKAT